MKRIAGVTALLIMMYLALFSSNPNAASASNLIEISNRQGFYGIITLAAGLLILSGSIDLSLGSVVGMGPAALLLTVLTGVLIGAIQGTLVYKLRLQSFLVTLCGMFIFRGIARLLTANREVGLQSVIRPENHPEFEASVKLLKSLLVGKSGDTEQLVFPAMMVAFLVIALVFAALLHGTVYGRYWSAIGYSEQAARYSGIAVGRYRVSTFMIGSGLAAFAGCLLLLNYGTVKPDNAGLGYELEAITGAVIGGVSLRGGEGTVVGMALGAAVLPLLRSLVNFREIPDDVIPVMVGLTLFLGSFVDEMIRRRGAARRG
jgi:ribose transport system permease protein